MKNKICSIIEIIFSIGLILVGIFSIINIELIRERIYMILLGFMIIRILFVISKQILNKNSKAFTFIQLILNIVVMILLIIFRNKSEILSYVILGSCSCDLVINILKSIIFRKAKNLTEFYGLDNVICILFILLLVINRNSEIITTATLFGCLVFYKGMVFLLSNYYIRKLFTINEFLKTIDKLHAMDILFGLIIVLALTAFILPSIEPNITTIGDAWWYCFAVITTIGFGDFTAVTLTGRILTVIVGFYGIIIVSLITSTTVLYITSENNKSKK